MVTGNAGANVSQAEFARIRNVSRKTVTLWKQKGWLVLDETGRVDVAATERLLNQRPTTYRGGTAAAAPAPPATSDADPSVQADEYQEAEVAPADPATPVYDASGKLIPSLAQSQRAKEYYLGELRRHELQVKNREVVLVEAVGVEVERIFSVLKETLLSVPGTVATSLVGKDGPTIEAELRSAIVEALHELHDPDGIAGRALAAEEAA